MAFDAGMTAALCRELSDTMVGSKIEKVCQPSADEIVLLCRSRTGSRKLLLSASASSARICETALAKENPKTPPMFCMQLRKHLTGAVIEGFSMHGFERVVEVALSAFDDLGFACRKYIEVEIMGKYSNLVFVEERDGAKKVLGVLKPVDFTTSSRRQVLGGMTYELPPSQDKVNPMEETAPAFLSRVTAFPQEKAAEKFLLDSYLGLSPLAAREIAFRAGVLGTALGDIPRTDVLYHALEVFRDGIAAGRFVPTMLSHPGAKGEEPFEFCFFDAGQYGSAAVVTTYPSFSALFDAYYGARERAAAMRSRCHDIETLIGAARHKLAKKIPQQQAELAACDEMDTYRLWGDLITASAYALSKKADVCEVVNYYSESLEKVKIPLDGKLTPAQNAARYYKKYAKLKTARQILTEQIAQAEEALRYLDSVEEAMLRAETEDDIAGIREELALSGFSPRRPNAPKQKQKPVSVHRHKTASGRDYYVGRNNLQNDYLTTKLAKKSDWWFHVKGGHGSHVILVCEPGEDPVASDFTEAAQAAAYYSSLRDGENVAVDYTEVRNVKKPSGAVPGKVIYTTYWTAYVNPAEPKE